MKKLFLIAFTIMLMLSYASCEEVTPEKIGDTENTRSIEASPTAAKTEVFKIGDIIQSGNLTFVVNGVREVPGTEFFKPNEGNIWYAVDITVENKSNESIQMSSLLMFKLVDSEGYSYSLAIGPEVKGSLDGELATGRKMSGEIPFEIPKDLTGLELEIDPSVWGNGKIIVKLDR